VTADDCTCPRLAIGLEVTEIRNWNADCPSHGTASAWWNSPEQQAERAARRVESIALQAKAKEMRRRAREARQEAGQ